MFVAFGGHSARKSARISPDVGVAWRWPAAEEGVGLVQSPAGEISLAVVADVEGVIHVIEFDEHLASTIALVADVPVGPAREFTGFDLARFQAMQHRDQRAAFDVFLHKGLHIQLPECVQDQLFHAEHVRSRRCSCKLAERRGVEAGDKTADRGIDDRAAVIGSSRHIRMASASAARASSPGVASTHTFCRANPAPTGR